MKLKAFALLATVAALFAQPAVAQVNEHTFKVGIGLSEDHPQAMAVKYFGEDRKSTRLNSSHSQQSRMPSSA